LGVCQLIVQGGWPNYKRWAEDDNQQNILGGGAGVGYQFAPFLGAYADYGTILSGGPNNAESNMFRIAVNFTYVNTKKVKGSGQ
jgi:hypothetical protein